MSRPYRSSWKRNILFALLLILVLLRLWESNRSTTPQQAPARSDVTNSAIVAAFKQQLQDIQVAGSGTVVKILADDNTGSRHQRLILQVAKGHTILLSHNIDLAPRIEDPQVGDLIEFYGEFAYNSRGGVVHWTHHDPRGRHVAGWLKHKGTLYQ